MQTEPLEEQRAWCLHGGLHAARHSFTCRLCPLENINYNPLAIIKSTCWNWYDLPNIWLLLFFNFSLKCSPTGRWVRHELLLRGALGMWLVIAHQFFLMWRFILTRNIGFHFTVIKCTFFSVIWRGNVLASEMIFCTNYLLHEAASMGLAFWWWALTQAFPSRPNLDVAEKTALMLLAWALIPSGVSQEGMQPRGLLQGQGLALEGAGRCRLAPAPPRSPLWRVFSGAFSLQIPFSLFFHFKKLCGHSKCQQKQCCSVAKSCRILWPPGLQQHARLFCPSLILRSLLIFMSIESVMPSNHPTFCLPFLLLPSIFPSFRVFSSESALCIRWPKYWSFSFSISMILWGSQTFSPWHHVNAKTCFDIVKFISLFSCIWILNCSEKSLSLLL